MHTNSVREEGRNDSSSITRSGVSNRKRGSSYINSWTSIDSNNGSNENYNNGDIIGKLDLL
jgi:hypothetical protein